MYGNDLSSRSRTLNGGRWRLTRFCSRCSASASVCGHDHLDAARPARPAGRSRAGVAARLKYVRTRAAATSPCRCRGPRRVRRGRGRRPGRVGSARSCSRMPSRPRELAYPAHVERLLACRLVASSRSPRRPRARGRPDDGARRRRGHRQARPTSCSRKARMRCCAWRGSPPCGSRRSGCPGQTSRRRATELKIAPQRRRRAPRWPGCASTCRSIHAGSTARRRSPPRRSAEFAAVRGRARRSAAVGRRRDRRQRAEPEPLLAAAVQPRRHRTPRRRPTSRCWRARTTPSRPSIPACASGVARSRHAATTGPAAATRTRRSKFLRDLGTAYRASGRTAPVMDGLAFHPYAGRLAAVAGRRRTRTRPRSASPTTTGSCRLLGTGVRRHGAARVGAADPLRRVRRSSRRSRRARRSATPAPSRPRRGRSPEVEAGRLLRARRCGSPSASRTSSGILALPLAGRDRARQLAVGRLLRRRDAEVELYRRPRRRSRARAEARSRAARGWGSR